VTTISRWRQAAPRGAGGGVELRFVVQQEHGLQAAGQHLAGVQAALPRQRVHQLRADGVGGFGEVADGGAGLLADPVRQRQQRRSVGMVRGGVAQQDRLALAGQQRLGDGLGGVVALPCSGALAPFSSPMAVATSASACTHWPAGT
jgi:hypothetical protein